MEVEGAQRKTSQGKLNRVDDIAGGSTTATECEEKGGLVDSGGMQNATRWMEEKRVNSGEGRRKLRGMP